ncbi:hypothetical protein TNCV_302211 [Trichonephila clavipes]|nr:hypothetical protein TNCV_302211 [Trichonephila clavipes]
MFIESSALEQVVATHPNMATERAGVISSQDRPVEVYSKEVLSTRCYTRAFCAGPRNFETWSSVADAPEMSPLSPNYHTNRRPFQLSTDLTCIAALK